MVYRKFFGAIFIENLSFVFLYFQRESKVVIDRHMGIEGVALENHGDVSFFWFKIVAKSSVNK